MEEKKIYNKICVLCGREYQSTSRGQRYCSDTCCEKAQKRKTKVNKARQVRRRRYNETREIQLALSATYKVAERVAFLSLKKECAAGGDPNVEGPLELHHKNGIVFDNRPSNLVWLTKSKHAKLHTLLPKINWVDIMEEAIKTGTDVMQIYEEKKAGADYIKILDNFLKEAIKGEESLKL